MNKYLIQFKGELEVEAEDKEGAQKIASDKFAELEKVITISEEKVVDKKSGYFI